MNIELRKVRLALCSAGNRIAHFFSTLRCVEQTYYSKIGDLYHAPDHLRHTNVYLRPLKQNLDIRIPMAPSIRVTLGTDAKVAPKDSDSNNYEFLYEVRATEPKTRSSRKYAGSSFVSDLSISH